MKRTIHIDRGRKVALCGADAQFLLLTSSAQQLTGKPCRICQRILVRLFDKVPSFGLPSGGK